MFNIDMVESKNGQVKIKDFSADVIETLLAFIYQVPVDDEKLTTDVLLAADKYNIEGTWRMSSLHWNVNKQL